MASMASHVSLSPSEPIPSSSASLISPPVLNNRSSPSPSADVYRGAVVEDMQLPPAFCLPQDENIGKAIEMAYERDFSHIPVLSKTRRPLGYIDVSALKTKWESGAADPEDPVLKYITRFKRSADNRYTLISPWTPLDELETFLDDNLFALVTDASKKFVLGVATRQDLDNFVTRRGKHVY